MPAHTISKDARVALGLTLAGALVLILALRAGWMPGILNPGIEGAVTAPLAGFMMALLHPVGYRRALAISAPPTAGSYVICAYAAGRAVGLGMAGVELVVMGVVGLVIVALDKRETLARGDARLAPRVQSLRLPGGEGDGNVRSIPLQR